MYIYIVKNRNGHVLNATISRTKAILNAIESNGVVPSSEAGQNLVRLAVRSFKDHMMYNKERSSIQVRDYEIEYFSE